MSLISPVDTNLKKIFIVTLRGTLVNFFLTVIKIFAGIHFHVDAVLADGIQSMTDLVSDMLLLIAVKFSYKPRSRATPFGNRKLETVFSLIIAMVLISTAAVLIRRALTTHADVGEDLVLLPALVVSIIAVVAKEILFRYTLRHGRQLRSPAVVANGYSHRADALSSAAVAACIVLSMIFGHFELWDRIGVAIVSVLILKAVWKIGGDALTELLDHAPSEEIMLQVEGIIDQDPEVVFVHNVRVRSVAGTLNISCTIEVNGGLTIAGGTRVAERVEQKLLESLEGVAEIMIRIMPAGHFAERVREHGIENIPDDVLV